ncbi:hypothetical protein V6R21_03760 [Limibacter armeniacum]|uniref:hypothetical protein n=1 Tax=Limibacter armeniacum TaxID=466084 RepID=UPI002FE55934
MNFILLSETGDETHYAISDSEYERNKKQLETYVRAQNANIPISKVYVSGVSEYVVADLFNKYLQVGVRGFNGECTTPMFARDGELEVGAEVVVATVNQEFNEKYSDFELIELLEWEEYMRIQLIAFKQVKIN